MSLLPHSKAGSLIKRDLTSLDAGQIAGIIVGIVVVALILIGIFIWRFLSYRNHFGPYTARGRQSSAKEKALAQTRGHIRSTRPKDADAHEFDDKTGLVNSTSEQRDLEEGFEEYRPSPIPEDSNSINGTVGEDDIAASKGKQRQQQMIDMDIHQGHYGEAAPVLHNSLNAKNTTGDTDTKQTKGSIRQGCTTM